MYTIALNTFREILRSKFFGVIIFFSILFFAIIIFFELLSLGQKEMIIPDFGFSFIETSGLLLILFLGNRLLSREFEEKTIYLTLSRPIRRGKIIFGKFLGFSAIMFLFIGILSIILLGLFLFYEISISPLFFLSVLGILGKTFILITLVLLFSVFLSGGIVTFGTLAVYIIAHSGYALLEFAHTHTNFMMLYVGKIILFFFPNFNAINFKDFYHSSELLFYNSLHSIVIPSILAFLYIIITLIFSAYFFEKKTFDNI